MFSKQQRSGIFLLLLLIASLLCIRCIRFSEEDAFNISAMENIPIQMELDSLRLIEIEN